MKKFTLYLVTWAGLATACGNQTQLDSSSPNLKAPKAPQSVEAPAAGATEASPVSSDEVEEMPPIMTEAAPEDVQLPPVVLAESPPAPVAPIGGPQTQEMISEPVAEPQPITGAFLMTCSWPKRGIQLRCSIASADAGVQVLGSQLKLALYDPMGRIIDESSYTLSQAQRGLSLDVTFALDAFMPDVSISLSKSSAPSATLARVEASDVDVIVGNVIAFEAPAFGGGRREFDIGSYTHANDYSGFLNSFGSMRLPPNMAVTICGNTGSRDVCHDYYGDLPNLFFLAQKVSSIKVYESTPFITIFRDWGQDTASQALFIGSWDHDQLAPQVRDQISALHIPEGLVVETYVSPGFTDDRVDYQAGDIDNTPTRNDIIKSLRIKLAP